MPLLLKRAFIIIPLIIRRNLRALNNIILKIRRLIYVNGSTLLELVRPRILLSIDLGFSR